MRHLLICLICLSTICCSNKETKSEGEKNQLVLINVGNASRSEIARALEKLAKCNVRVIGMNMIFKDLKLNESDTLLSNAIEKCKNVILVTIISKDKLIKSHQFFSKSSMAEGVLYFGFNDDVVDSQMIYITFENNLLWSFPVTVTSYFNPQNSDHAMHKALGNEYYMISSKNNNYDRFDIAGLDTVSCSRFQGRIVLMGFLGPGDEDTFKISSTKKSYGTIILANCIEDILNEHFEIIKD